MQERKTERNILIEESEPGDRERGEVPEKRFEVVYQLDGQEHKQTLTGSEVEKLKERGAQILEFEEIS